MDNQYRTQMTHQQQMSTKTMLFATVVGITIGGPLLALMGFSFLATMTLFVVTSPLLLIFSPVLMGAGFLFVAALIGFGAAGVMAIAGLAALGWVFRSVKGSQLQQAAGKLVDYGQNLKESVKDTGRELGGQLKQTVQNSTENRTVANQA